jgi:hypothetical protein
MTVNLKENDELNFPTPKSVLYLPGSNTFASLIPTGMTDLGNWARVWEVNNALNRSQNSEARDARQRERFQTPDTSGMVATKVGNTPGLGREIKRLGLGGSTSGTAGIGFIATDRHWRVGLY